MKLYTNESQTAKLIELGFAKPKNERWVLDIANESTPSIQNVVKRQDYTVGELIEMLPRRINGHNGIIDLYRNSIDYNTSDDILSLHQRGEFYLRCAQGELIDTIYEVLVKLKEEGVI